MNQKTNNDCGCGTDCCTPSKKSPVKIIIFSIIIIAALGIVAIKVLRPDSKQNNSVISKTDSIQNPSNDSLKSCCPKGEKTDCCAK